MIENISVSFCLWAPGYGLTDSVMHPRSSSRGAIQVPQLQLQADLHHCQAVVAQTNLHRDYTRNHMKNSTKISLW